MPVFKNSLDFQILRDARAFLSLEGGVIRGATPRKQHEREVLRKDQEISHLRRELAEANKKLEGTKAASSNGQNPNGQPLEQDASGERDVPIFFIIGSPKSGTTWLRKMLDQHPDILCRGEGRFFGRYDRNENAMKNQTNMTGHSLRPASLYNALSEDEYLRLWLERTVWTRDGDTKEHIMHLTREAVRHFLGQELSKTNKKIVGDKTPFQSADTVREIHEMLPEARVIHIIRDGRDQAVSHNHHRWNRVRPVEEGGHLTPEERSKRDRYRENPEKFLASGESIFSEEYITAAARGWRSNVGGTREYGASSLGEKYAEVRYEDLLENPQKEIRQIFRFLGARDAGWIARKSVERNTFERQARSQGRQQGEEDSTRFLRKGVAGDWRGVFNERDKRIYKEIAGDLLIELGYKKDSNW